MDVNYSSGRMDLLEEFAAKINQITDPADLRRILAFMNELKAVQAPATERMEIDYAL